MVTIELKKNNVPTTEGYYIADRVLVKIVDTNGALLALTADGDSYNFAKWRCDWSDRIEIK